MAVITPGTGATINAPTIEGQLFQLLHLINAAESAVGGSDNKFSLDKSEEGILSSTFKLPGQIVYTPATGTFVESPLPYLPTLTFTAGSPVGTIKSTTLSTYFIECCLYLLTWQRNGAKNTQKVTGIALDFDYADASYSGSLSLPYVSSLGSNGAISESATEWLLT
ncbi:MAG: hypothetical protein P2A85_09155 [Microcoleus anatoxicus]|uniref:hypothetical protein n=1 Tax=Microcoleus anatoxicus TaxID=2705319 RepID=UPI00366FDA92